MGRLFSVRSNNSDSYLAVDHHRPSLWDLFVPSKWDRGCKDWYWNGYVRARGAWPIKQKLAGAMAALSFTAYAWSILQGSVTNARELLPLSPLWASRLGMCLVVLVFLIVASSLCYDVGLRCAFIDRFGRLLTPLKAQSLSLKLIIQLVPVLIEKTCDSKGAYWDNHG